MKKKEQIFEEVRQSESESYITLLLLEVLIDIRDVLKKISKR